MAGRLFFALFVFLMLREYCSSENIADADEDELSRRAVKGARGTYRKLKTSFIKLGRPGQRGRKGYRKRELDIVFVIDKSGSIRAYNFNLAKRFVEELIESFPVFPAKARVAIVSYSNNVKLEFNFKKYPNRECVRKAIKAIRYTGGATATGDALKYVQRSLIFNSAAGARYGTKKIIFVLTDGRSNRGVRPRIPARELKRKGVLIFALGITRRIRRRELLSFASGRNYVFQVRNFYDLNRVTRLLRRDTSRRCYYGQTVYDECGRRCKCIGGKLVKCCRLRKEFTEMSYTERVRYVKTVKTASTNPVYKPRYEQLLTLHKNIFNSNIHAVDFFLPWHRWFILQYENLLREIDCRVTVPYWDWSLVSASPFTSSLWNTGPNGFGGNGVGSQRCVNTGPFREGVWSLISSAGGGCLQRNFNGQTRDAIAVSNLVKGNPAANFINFELMLRIEFHNLVHCVIDGTMCSLDSASAPEFFLHHGFIDKIWWDWQKQSNAHKFNTYFTTQTGIMPSTGYRSRDFLDLNNQPGCVCADYVQPKSTALKKIQGMTRAQMKSIPRLRLRLPSASAKAAKLFRTSQADLRRVAQLRATIAPTRTLTRASLKGKDAKMGFKETDLSKAGAKGATGKSGASDEEVVLEVEKNF